MLISEMKQKPEVYIGEVELERIQLFISGYLFCNIVNNQADYVDYSFKNGFHKWVKEYIEKLKNMKFSEQRNYVYYISQAFEAEESVDVFFDLCNHFFEMIEKEQ